MKKLLLLFVTISTLCQAQHKVFVYPNFVGQEFDSIQKNKNWTILRQATGDVNADGKEDMAIVLESIEEVYEQRYFGGDLVKQKARIILVLLNKEQKRIVHTQNNKFVERAYEGGMTPYLEPTISIEDQKLIFFQEYTRSSVTHTFELLDNIVKLTHTSGISTEAATAISTQTIFDFRKGELEVITGTTFGDDKKETIKFTPIIKALSELNDMFEWEVVDGYRI